MQRSPIQKLMLYELELGHNTIEATKSICCEKNEDAVDHVTVIRQFKKFCLNCENLNNQTRSFRLKTGFQSHTPNHRGESSKSHLESIRQTWHLTILCSFSPLWPRQKSSELPIWSSLYQNITKILTRSFTIYIHQREINTVQSSCLSCRQYIYLITFETSTLIILT